MDIKKWLLAGVLSLFAVAAAAQEMREVKIDEVEVNARRKLSEVGVTRTSLDSAVLRDNVTSSMADLLAQNTTIFIKSYGRGSMASASFRGTAPSHTQVLWNGMKLNSPMLGMVDFSMIPSYFIDGVDIYPGASSVNVSGGGLGGAIALSTRPPEEPGWGLRFIQGYGSFDTWDEFLRVDYAGERFQSTTRFSYTVSENDFPYIDYQDPTLEGTYPRKRNRNGRYRDLHAMQEIYWQTRKGDRFGAAVWFVSSKRGIPMLNIDQRESGRARNEQTESTLRAVASWNRVRSNAKFGAKAGWIYTNSIYTFEGDNGNEALMEMQHAQSIVKSGFAEADASWFPNEKWMIEGSLSAQLHSAYNRERYTKTHYDKMRAELSLLAQAKYRPWERLGIGADVRWESYGRHVCAPVPAGFVEVILWPRYNLLLKASVTRNLRFPTLNDLYFQPGGNPDLKSEKGYTWDGGIEWAVRKRWFDFSADFTAYNSHIRDWILWLPTARGFWTPVNVNKVHSYGVELREKLALRFGKGWTLDLNANWSWTPSINYGDKKSWSDESIGKQLPYIPRYSSNVVGRLGWRGFSFVYKYVYYSERFTTTSNDTDVITRLGSYYMSDIILEKLFRFGFGDLSVKFCVYNLYDEAYVSVLSRPMPGRNYGVALSIAPSWGSKNHRSE